MDGSGFPNLSRGEQGGLAAELEALAARLAPLAAPLEAAFTAIGDRLSGALEGFGGLDADFAALADRLEAKEARTAADTLKAALRQSQALTQGMAELGGLLGGLKDQAAAAARPLATLAKIVEEIGALAINAKVEAAHVRALDLDFSVFTTEIGRLRRRAEDAIGRAAFRLGSLREAIGEAQHAQSGFEAAEAGRLDDARDKLESSLGLLAERQGRAAAAMAAVAAKSRTVAEHTRDAVAELQIGDMTNQRLGHVQDALALLAILARGDGSAPGCEWVAELDSERRQALVVSVCRLQDRHLTLAAADFSSEVERLAANLDGLARDAAEMRAQAASAFGGQQAGLSFMSELKAQAEAAAGLLDGYAQAEDHVLGLVRTVSAEFARLTDDLTAIHAIETDIRMMGLNASLKCGRLGPEGRALGVVAQELRASSHRTQEASAAALAAIRTAVALADGLGGRAEDGRALAAGLTAMMSDSVAALTALGRPIDEATAGLDQGSARIAGLLRETAGGITIHQTIAEAAAQIRTRLARLAKASEGDLALEAQVQDDVRRLVEGHYTMASERVIHQLFSGEVDDPAVAPGAEDVDGFLF